MSRQLRPRKPKEEKDDDEYYDENKNQRGGENREAYNAHNRNYYKEKKDEIKKRRSAKEIEKSNEKNARINAAFRKKLAELRIKYPYIEYDSKNAKDMEEIGVVKETKDDGYTYIYKPKVKNIYCCSSYGYYKYIGNKKMDMEKFFSTVVIHRYEEKSVESEESKLGESVESAEPKT
uniref:Uncharacterized protein n=1 Tax=Panagrolaimus sp. ES5 TaxID=591445 RepID=A0AC34G362_9BILA